MAITHTVTFDDPREIAAPVREMAGLEFLRGLIARRARVPIAATLGFTLAEVAEGHAVFEARVIPAAYNPIGSVQGGWYAAVLDAASGVALHTLLAAGEAYATAEFKVNLLKAARAEHGVLRATGRVIHKGRSTALTEAQLVGPDGAIFAHCTATQLILAPTTTP